MSLLSHARYEIIPLKSADAAIAALPPRSSVSVTCSPAKGVSATLELCAKVYDAGHKPVPHIAARMVEGPKHVAEIAASLHRLQISELFIVGGDHPEPLGPYNDGLLLLKEFLQHDHGLRGIGFPAYPDGHAAIPSTLLHEALHAKTSLAAEAGLSTFVSTQMCFDAARTRRWLEHERSQGLFAEVHLGVPGVIDKVKLMTMGARLGVGSSLRFLKKNRATLGRLLAPGGYEPSGTINDLEPHAAALGITGLHLFTFNEVAATVSWQQSLELQVGLERVARSGAITISR